MIILSIETSCDDTGVAILKYDKIGQPKILANLVSSQIKVHAPWGGVVPMLAKREHQRNLIPLLIKALKKISPSRPIRYPEPATRFAGVLARQVGDESSEKDSSATPQNDKIKILNKILEREPELLKKLLPFLKKYRKPDIDYVAVTVGPGLEPALWVGVNFARALSYWYDIPILPINHIEAHICANWLKPIGANDKIFPAIALVVSGGHTQLILVKNIGQYKIVGETRDDAAGEAFDKVAKMLNLGYPGGPKISQLAAKFKSQIPITNFQTNLKTQITKNKIIIKLPRPMINSGDFDFSFSGLKTAVLYALQKMTPAQIKKQTPAIAAEFQQAVIDVLIAKTTAAAKKYNAKTIVLAGGVAANKALRNSLSLITKNLSLNFLVPPLNLCADNAAMIGLAAYWQLAQNRAKKVSWRTLKAQANLRIS